jgi:hypothetical protein
MTKPFKKQITNPLPRKEGEFTMITGLKIVSGFSVHNVATFD